ncbi:MAG TPA: sigma-70 family RNA polymerase sigma factor [Terracidiphilus sp.]|nr:sigma-70 family RNA polymerase sigma factor [Terracidiphilus sp.]
MRPELSEAIGLLRSNSPESVERAIGLLQNTVYSFSMKVCGHREDAEDTMQEVLYRSLQHLARIEEPRALAVWLYTVTRNRCSRMRGNSAHRAKQVSLDELMPDEAEVSRLLRDPAPGPESKLLQGEQRDLLRQAVLQIPPQLRIVLVLHDMEDLSTEDVAKILNLQPGTVRVRLHRARLSVRKEISRSLSSAARKEEQSERPTRKLAPKGDHRPTTCRELFSNLSEYLDGRVEPRSCAEMRAHIDSCPACVAFLRDLRSAIDRCRSLEVDCDPAILDRLRTTLTQEYLHLTSPGVSGK